MAASSGVQQPNIRGVTSGATHKLRWNHIHCNRLRRSLRIQQKNRAIEWIYEPVSGAAFETPYVQNGTASNPGTATPVIANGICYIDSNEHTPSAPYERGFATYAINMTDGSLVYRLDEEMVARTMSDGYTMYDVIQRNNVRCRQRTKHNNSFSSKHSNNLRNSSSNHRNSTRSISSIA